MWAREKKTVFVRHVASAVAGEGVICNEAVAPYGLNMSTKRWRHRENRFGVFWQRNKEGPSFRLCNSLLHFTARKTLWQKRNAFLLLFMDSFCTLE